MRLTVPIVIPGAGAGDMLASSNLADLLDKATGRNNLRVVERDDVWASALARAIRGGVFFTGAASYGITGAASMPIGLNDFSILLTLQAADYTPSVNQILWISNGGNSQARVTLATTGAWLLTFIDAAGAATAYTLTPDVPLVDGEVYHVAITADRDGNATLYINSETDRDYSGAGVAQAISGSAGVDIGGSGASGGWSGFNTFTGVVYGQQLFNRLLTAARVKAMFKTGIVDNADVGATGPYLSNFSAGADSWTASGTSVITGNTDGIGGEDDTLLIDSGAGTRAAANRETTFAIPSGKRVRLRARVYRPASNTTGVAVRFLNSAGAATGDVQRTIPADTWTLVDVEFVTTAAGTGVGLWLYTAGGSATVTAGDKFYVRDVRYELLGCWQDLDLGVGFGTNTPDRAGNFAGTLASSAHVVSRAAAAIPFGATPGAPDAYLVRESANQIAQRNGTAAQVQTLYGTYIDGSNYSRLRFQTSVSSDFLIQMEKAGSPSIGRFSMRSAAGQRMAFGVGATDHWHIHSDGTFQAEADNTKDIGASGANRPRSGYFGTSLIAPAFRTSPTGPRWTSGTGSPEGVVTDGVGSMYTRTDGAAGTTLYVKESGAGNTGWVAK